MASLINSAQSGGSGSMTIQGPATNLTQTLTLPDVSGTFGVLSLGTSQVSTSGTNIDFTNIPSTVRRITVMFNGVSTNGTNLPLIQLGAGSVTTTGYISASVNLQNGSAVSVGSSTAGFIVFQNAASEATAGSVTFTLFGSNTWIASGTMISTTGVILFTNVTGSVALSGTLDRVRITTVGGTDTFDAGSINIMYE